MYITPVWLPLVLICYLTLEQLYVTFIFLSSILVIVFISKSTQQQPDQ
jgi:hypothetical protein